MGTGGVGTQENEGDRVRCQEREKAREDDDLQLPTHTTNRYAPPDYPGELKAKRNY